MEKIQSAIAKARATRDANAGISSNSGPQTGPNTSGPGFGAAQVLPSAAAWASLPALHLDGADLRKKRIVAYAGGPETVSFDVMRTKVLQQIRANGWRRLAVTSPTAGCGKSTIAVNLALSLARQPELRTVLLDLDLRRPSLAKMLGIHNRPSFAQVLAGKLAFDQVAMRYSEGLAVAANDGPAHNPAELLHGSSVATALTAIETQYAPDLMIFDMPPMLVSDDTMAFIGQVDAVLLIAAAGMTTLKEVDACERELASQSNVMGVILNKCEYMGKEYGYTY
jgi:Mrp family chromosome partitioning ATPase